MYVTLINDCRDENARMRLQSKVASEFRCWSHVCGVRSPLEAAGCLVDVIDAGGYSDGWVLVNVAPRTKQTSVTNGSSFGYLDLGGVKIIASVECLCLLPKFGVCEYRELDLTRAITQARKAKRFRGQGITQFRSLEIIIPCAAWIEDGLVKTSCLPQSRITPVEDECCWYIDCFGNVKTSLLGTALKRGQKRLRTRFGMLPIYATLSDAPVGKPAVVTGSSGFGVRDHQFLEIVVKGGSAADKLSIKVGDHIFR